jgi:hypothetical protein
MAESEGKTARKRPSRGVRKHIRRIKQESRKMGISAEDMRRRLRQAELAGGE